MLNARLAAAVAQEDAINTCVAYRGRLRNKGERAQKLANEQQ